MIIAGHSRSRCAGFSIVEALVALVVLSIGMLGIAALYVESLRAGRSAIYRTHAVNLASDMADRIRANRNARQSYALAADGDPDPAGCAAGDTSCTLAQNDLVQWLGAIATQLPGRDAVNARGTVSVSTPPAAPQTRQYSIEVSWFEPSEPQPLTYVLNMQI